MSKAVDAVTEIATPIALELGLELVDVEYVKEGKNWFLRVYADKENGINIDECAELSERLSLKLDELDPITENYFLEVSSPGAERPLKKTADFEKAIGKNVHVKTYESINGEKEFEGILLHFDEVSITLQMKIKTARKEIVIPYEKVAKARLAVTF
jgi:ribosome maturation factor RimP